MLQCEHCKIKLPGSPKSCPLCQNRLTGIPEQGDTGSPYPLSLKKPGTLSRKLLLWISFGCICSAVISFAINISVSPGDWWSLFVLIGIACFWLDFAVILKKRQNLPNSITWQVIIISGFAVLWDMLTGYRGWSLDYVIPGLCVIAMFALVLLARVRAPDIQEYVLYLLVVCVFGLVSFVFVLTGIVQVAIPSVISFIAAVVFLAFLLFFEGKALFAELRRRFHL